MGKLQRANIYMTQPLRNIKGDRRANSKAPGIEGEPGASLSPRINNHEAAACTLGQNAKVLLNSIAFQKN
jgi:hypothetical protein